MWATLSQVKMFQLNHLSFRWKCFTSHLPHWSCIVARGGWAHSGSLSWQRWLWTDSWQRGRAAGWQSWGLQGRWPGPATCLDPSGPPQTAPKTLWRHRVLWEKADPLLCGNRKWGVWRCLVGFNRFLKCLGLLGFLLWDGQNYLILYFSLPSS